MPSLTKIKYPDIKKCNFYGEECLCVTCELLYINPIFPRSKECTDKKCHRTSNQNKRNCKEPVCQCNSYKGGYINLLVIAKADFLEKAHAHFVAKEIE